MSITPAAETSTITRFRLMSRPLRVEYEGAVYHVTVRGNSGQQIYERDQDRDKFLSLLAREIAQQRWLCHAYCLLGTHYHVLLETPEANLSRGMRRLNGSANTGTVI